MKFFKIFILFLIKILTLSIISGKSKFKARKNILSQDSTNTTNTTTPTNSTTPTIQTANTFTIPITINSNFTMGFMGNVMIGTPPQNLPILFDSGANSFQVSSSNCTNCDTYSCTNSTICPTPLPMFQDTQSSTFSAVWKSTNYSVQYGGTGVSTGPYSVNDTVQVVGVNGNNLVIPNISFNVITNGTQLSGISGDCGMGKTSPLVPNAYNDGIIPSNEFTTYFNASIGSGYIFIGGNDTSVTPAPVWYQFSQKNSSNKAWNLGFNALNGISTNPAGEKINLDFGAGIQQFPSYFNVSQFWQAISSTGNCSMYGNYLQCKCYNNNGTTDMKALVINLLLSNGSSVEFSLPAQYYLTYIPTSPLSTKVNGTCRTNIQFVTSTGLSPRLSATWQQYFYMNYNIATTNVQIAPIPGISTANITTTAPVTLNTGYVW